MDAPGPKENWESSSPRVPEYKLPDRSNPSVARRVESRRDDCVARVSAGAGAPLSGAPLQIFAHARLRRPVPGAKDEPHRQSIAFTTARVFPSVSTIFTSI